MSACSAAATQGACSLPRRPSTNRILPKLHGLADGVLDGEDAVRQSSKAQRGLVLKWKLHLLNKSCAACLPGKMVWWCDVWGALVGTGGNLVVVAVVCDQSPRTPRAPYDVIGRLG